MGILVALDLNDNGLLRRGHLKSAGTLSNIVVVKIGPLGGLIARDGALARASLGLGTAVDNVGHSVVTDKASSGEVGRGERLAVIGFGSVLGRNGHIGLGNGERAVHGLDLELARHVVALGVGHLGGASDVIGVGASVGRLWILGGEAGDRVLLTVDLELIGLESLSRVLGAVVGGIGGVSLDRDVLGRATRSHVKGAGLDLDVVVVGIGAVLVTPLGDSALAGARSGLGAGVLGVGNALAVDEGAICNFPIGCDKSVAVVDLRRVLRLNGHIAFIDGELTVNRSYIELRSDVVALGILYHGSAGHLIGVLACIGSGNSRTQPLNSKGCPLIVGEGSVGQTRNRVHDAAIRLSVRVGGNRNLILILIGASVDYQFAELERDLVVIKVSTLGISRVKLILVRSGKDVVLVVPGELLFGKNAIIAHKAVATYLKVGTALQRLSIVILVALLRLKRNLTLANVELTVGNFELHVGVVLCRIARKRELSVFQSHHICIGIGAGNGRRTSKHDITRSNAGRQRSFNDVITLDSLLFAVVFLAALVTSNGNSNLIGNGADMQIARLHLGDDIVIVGAHLAHGAVGKLVGVVTNIGTLAAIKRNAVEGSACSFGQISRVAVDALLRAVIGLGVRVRRQSHVLVIVELDNVLIFVNRKLEALGIVAYRGITAKRFRLDVIDGFAVLAGSIVGSKRFIGTVPVVFNFVVNGICRVVEINRSIGTHNAHLSFVRYGSVSNDSDWLLRDRLAFHIAGKGLRRRNRRRRSLEIIVHLD